MNTDKAAETGRAASGLSLISRTQSVASDLAVPASGGWADGRRAATFGLMHLLIAALALCSAANAQTASDVNEGLRISASGDTFTVSWWARPGRTYFARHSDDMTNWTWLTVIETGEDAVKQYGFTSTGERFFLRLKSIEMTATDPALADFDGDGTSNLAELEANRDPMYSDIDSEPDGMIDGSEAGRNAVIGKKDHPGVGLSLSISVID